MSKIQVDTIDTRSGTSTMTIGSTNTTTIALKSGATLTNFPVNTPAFRAIRTSSNQTISNATTTKIQFNGEDFDSYDDDISLDLYGIDSLSLMNVLTKLGLSDNDELKNSQNVTINTLVNTMIQN